MQKHFYQKPSDLLMCKHSISSILSASKAVILSILFAFCCNITSIYAQNKNLSITIQNQSVKTALAEIEKVSGYDFFFNNKHVDLNRIVSLSANNEDIQNILNKLFEGTDVAFAIKDKKIILTSRTLSKKQKIIKISGTVVDALNQPVIGASIVDETMNNGTITNVDGQYSLNVVEDTQLTVSFLGYKTYNFQVKSGQNINIVLQEDNEMLDEVVVIGYGTQSRSRVTTAVSKVNNEVFENIPFTNATSSLQGSVSGVRVQSISGQPGSEPRIIVRGGTSINNPDGATPLYIVDGIIRPSLADIATEEIESLQVLKDAASTSIYGARGSNGVVIVTTKSGKKGKVNVDYRFNLTISQNERDYDFANAEEYLIYMRTGMIADKKFGITAEQRLSGHLGYGTGNNLTNNTFFSTQYLNDENRYKLQEGWKSMPDPIDPSKTLLYSETDYEDKLYRTGISHNHHLAISGGTDKATFSLGMGFMDSQGTVITTSYKRYNFNLASSLNILDNLKVNSRVTYSNSNNYGSPLAADATFYRAAATPPTTKFTFEDGSLAPGASQSIGNPVYHLNKQKREYNTEALSISVDADWEILKGLSFRPIFSMYRTRDDKFSFWKAYLNGPTDYRTGRNASASNDKYQQYQAEAVLNYRKTFVQDHNLDAVLGYSFYSRKTYVLSAAGKGASTDLVPTLNAASIPTSINSVISQQNMLGYFARINYDYKNKYLLSITARYDGASNLGDNNKWGFFPGVSLGWHVDKEKFWSFMPENLMTLKLRTSYGVNGNISGLGDFTAQGNYSVGSKYLGKSAIILNALMNQDLSWEESKTFDIGADVTLFNNRLSIIFDYFKRKTDNLLTERYLPHSTGFESVKTNLGKLQNTGIELEVSSHILSPSCPVQWDLGFNISRVKNKILELPDNGIDRNRIGGEYIWNEKLHDYVWAGGLQEGGRMGDLFAYKMVGIYATDEDAQNPSEPTDMIMTTTDKKKYGGDVKWLDADKNGIIDSRDRVYMGNIYPDWTGGINTSLSYKGISLYCRLDFSLGHTIYNYAKNFLDYNWQGDNNITKDMIKRSWKKQGDIAELPRFYWYGDRGQQNTIRGNSVYYEDGDYLAIRELTLSYSLPKNIVKKMCLSGLRFSVSGNNLHYFTKYKGLNPEEGGKDNGRYAVPRNVIFSANVSF